MSHDICIGGGTYPKPGEIILGRLSENINAAHISEAINYRNPDRDGWAG